MLTASRAPLGHVFRKKRSGHVSTGKRVGIRPWAEALEIRLNLSTFIVTDTSDNAADPGSLRHAVAQANTAGSGTILFDLISGQNTVTLENVASYPNGFLYPAGPSAFVITGDINIQGTGQLLQRDSGAADFRLFYVAPGATLALNDLQLSGGIAQGHNGGLGDSFGGGGGGAAGLGGGIFVEQGTLTLNAVTINGNQAIGGTGGNATGGSGQGGAGGGGMSGAGGLGHIHSGGPGGGPNGGVRGSGAQDGGGGGFGGGGGGAGTSAFGGRGGLGGGGGGGGNTSGFGGDGGFGGGGGGGGSFFGSGGVGGFGGGHGGQGRGGSGGGGGGGFGGGIFLDHGSLSITNSTLTGNTAQGGAAGTGGISGGTGTGGYGYGGAIFNVNGNVTLKYDTIAANTAGSGGALYDLSFLDSSGHFTVTTASATMTDSILSNSTASDLVIDERGFGGTALVTATMNEMNPTNIVPSTNIINGSVNGSFTTTDPDLAGSLSTKAGFTPLMEFTSTTGPATTPGGIAINGVATDQWGQTRTAFNIGSFESVSPPGDVATPADATINAGGNASFSSTATGAPTPTEQWQLSTNGGANFNNITNGGIYSGATTGTLSITGASALLNGYEYQDVFTNGSGSATTDPATLTVDFAPTVTTNPTNHTINGGSNATFTVAATANPTPTVQWQVSTNGGDTFNNLTNTGIYSGVTSNTLTLTGATLTKNGYEYRAVFSNTLFGAGSPSNATTTAATLTVSAAPVVSVNPVSATINAGGNASFSSTATGAPTPTEQWQLSTNGGDNFNNLSNGGVYSGATSATLVITGGAAAMNGYEYRDAFTNGNGAATTNPATLTVDFAPTVMTNPTNETVNTGSIASFTIAATANPTPSVQWQLSTDGGATFNNLANTGIYSGVTSDILAVTGATLTENGYEYRAVFSNTLSGAGSPSSATTTAATLTVGAPVITVSAFAQLISSTSNTGTLHVQAEQDGTDANLLYTWSIISQPTVASVGRSVGVGPGSAAPQAIFSINGTNGAANTAVTFLTSGQYTLQVTATNGSQSVTSDVQVTAHVNAASAHGVTQTATQVSGVQTLGTAQSITGFVVTFNGPVDPTTAQNVHGYRILRQYTVSKNGNFLQKLFGGGGTQTENAAYKIASAVYDSQTNSVILTLASPTPVKNGVREVQVLGTGPHAVLAANLKPIDGDASGKPGGNFTYRFSMTVAKSVTYKTTSGDRVSLSLAGPGKIVALLPSGTQTPVIDLIDTDSTTSILTGKIRKARKGLGYAVLNELNGTATADIQLGSEFHVNQNSGAAVM